MNLIEFVRKFQDNQILLPDFQRGFVWKEEERQVRLLASVLSKMPLGSILLLEANPNEYGCKKIGRKERLDTSNIEHQNVDMLLDGQQRMTVLTNIFSSVIFDGIQRSRELISEDGLKRRFFIVIPAYNKNTANDLFGINKLNFPIGNPTKDTPTFLSSEVREFIKVENFNFGGTNLPVYHPHVNELSQIENWCVNSNEYHIPLYLMIETNAGESTCEISLKNILQKIVYEVADRILDDYLTKNHEEKSEFLSNLLAKQYLSQIKDFSNTDHIKDVIIKQGNNLWKERIYTFIHSCIDEMNLNQINVLKAQRERAIDIYENLNLGGVTLSTFELVLARAAQKQDVDNENLFDKITAYINNSKQYAIEIAPEIIQEKLQLFTNNNDYSVSKDMGCYNSKNNELNKKYSDAFLNILSLICNVPNYDPDSIKIDLIKRSKILELTSEQINSNCQIVCEGIDRALFFLHFRCGLRSIDELQYNLILVLLGYVFTNEKHYMNKVIHKRLEAWYWSVIFSGEFDTDQNSNMIINLSRILKEINNGLKFCMIDPLKDKVFNRDDFSDKDLILMNKNKNPKEVIKNSICQFYLAKTYYDLIALEKTDQNEPDTYELISVMMDGADKLEKHHIIPLGSISSQLSAERNNKSEIKNSPVNFLYITPYSNKKILNASIGDYIKYCQRQSVFKLGMSGFKQVEKPEEVKDLLSDRFDQIKQDVLNHITTLLH